MVVSEDKDLNAPDRAHKLHSTGAKSMSNGHDLPLLAYGALLYMGAFLRQYS